VGGTRIVPKELFYIGTHFKGGLLYQFSSGHSVCVSFSTENDFFIIMTAISIFLGSSNSLSSLENF
jgi:hypothetical protein